MRDIDLLTHAIFFARQQGGHDAIGQHDGAHLIGDAASNAEWFHIGLTNRGHDARASQPHIVKGRLTGIRPERTVAAGAGVDELRVALGERLVADPQLVCHAFPKVLDKDIRLLSQFVDNLYGLGVFEIEGETLLMPVIGLEVEIRATRRPN